MTNEVMTNVQYNLLAQLHSLIESMNNEDDNFKELVDDADLFGGKIDDIQGDIERRIEIVEFIKRYEVGQLQDSASMCIANNMSIVIIEAQSDYVFGYVPYEDGTRKFFLSEIESEVDEDDEDIVNHVFSIGDGEAKFNTNIAMMIGGR